MVKTRRTTFSILFLCGILLVGTVSAQASLVPNVPRTDEHLGFSPSNLYVATLEAGHWTVIVSSDSFWGLEVKITVSWDSSSSNAIAVSGNGTGNYPRVDFTLSSNATVYILVSENSVYGDTSGMYDIGVYDDAHLPSPLIPDDPFDWMILIMVIVVLSVVFIGVACARRATPVKKEVFASITVEAPLSVVPQEQQEKVLAPGRQTTTVRLPLKCPSCGADVSPENVDWVGPLEAKCAYCGATMRATFEEL
ncbi:MAG: hypothetical protein ACTSV3_06565 [Candidatus Thorarchaeota archaeon]